MKCTVGEVLRRHFASYAASRPVPGHYWRAAGALSRCRTAALGGHVRRCANGHIDGVWYNSCHHRWCPQCNGLVNERWLERQRWRLLGCAHRHLVFTIPSELRAMFRGNERVMSEALFQSVRETVLELVADGRHVGGRPGLLLARHTWGRSLSYHPHIHCLVTEGALDGAGVWREPRRGSFLPARVVMAVFRGKYLGKVRALVETGEVRLGHERSRAGALSELNRLGRTAWNVRVGERYGHGEGVATYLARYVRGGPLRDRQLRVQADGRVVLRYRSHRDQRGRGRVRKLRLAPEAFLGRYLMHVPAHRRRLVRCYGLYAGGGAARRADARHALGHRAADPPPEPLDWLSYLRRVGAPPERYQCRVCGAPLSERVPLARGQGPP